MKKTLTLIVIASVILISVSCQKEDLPVTAADIDNTCPSNIRKGQINPQDVSAEKKIQIVVACKACHAYKEDKIQ